MTIAQVRIRPPTARHIGAQVEGCAVNPAIGRVAVATEGLE